VERFHTGDNLIFVREDFQQLGRSAIWQQLRRIGSRKSINSPLPWRPWCQQHPMKVGNLDSVLKNRRAIRRAPKSLPRFRRRDSAPASRSKPARVPTPPVPSWMNKSGYRDHSDDLRTIGWYCSSLTFSIHSTFCPSDRAAGSARQSRTLSVTVSPNLSSGRSN